LELLATAAKLRPAFNDDNRPAVNVLKLADGTEQPHLIGFPSVAGLAGPHQYARLVAGFDGRYSVHIITAPGFLESEVLPTSIDATIDLLTDSLLASVDNAPVVLLGQSSGGWLAHAVAERLESEGRSVDGLILLDTYLAGNDTLATFQTSMTSNLFARESTFGEMDHIRLGAMGTYFTIFGQWRPSPVTAPTLFVCANESLAPSAEGDDWRATWELPHDSVEVPGNHFTIMEDHAVTTASAIQEWVQRLTTTKEYKRV